MTTAYSLLLSVALTRLTLTGTFGADIINGKKVKKNSMLYMASVQINGKHRCGGFLINQSYVLTAAHCDESCPRTENQKIKILSNDEPLKPKCQIAGWGKTKQQNVDHLLVTEVQTINLTTCQKTWKNREDPLPDNVLCAEGVKKKKCRLSGRFGWTASVHWESVGHCLFGNCDPTVPNIYTQILKYKVWIKKMINRGA